VLAGLPATGRALIPFPPVHVRAEQAPGGDLICGWMPRPRGNWIWSDGGEQADPDGAARYLVSLLHEDILLAEAEIFATEWTVPAASLAELALPASLMLAVRRVGIFAQSDPATAQFTLEA
jgi:hypothetical protein